MYICIQVGFAQTAALGVSVRSAGCPESPFGRGFCPGCLRPPRNRLFHFSIRVGASLSRIFPGVFPGMRHGLGVCVQRRTGPSTFSVSAGASLSRILRCFFLRCGTSLLAALGWLWAPGGTFLRSRGWSGPLWDPQAPQIAISSDAFGIMWAPPGLLLGPLGDPRAPKERQSCPNDGPKHPKRTPEGCFFAPKRFSWEPRLDCIYVCGFNIGPSRRAPGALKKTFQNRSRRKALPKSPKNGFVHAQAPKGRPRPPK